MNDPKKTGRERAFRNQNASENPQRQRMYSMGDILPGILSRYGIGRSRPEDDLAEHWETLAGNLASQTFVIGLRRGVLEIGVTNALFIQEMIFRKQEILKKLRKIYPDGNILDIRFRVEKKPTKKD